MDPSKSTRRNTDKKDKAAKSLLPPKLSSTSDSQTPPTSSRTPIESLQKAATSTLEDEIDVAAELEPPIEEQEIEVEEEEIVEEIEEEVVHDQMEHIQKEDKLTEEMVLNGQSSIANEVTISSMKYQGRPPNSSSQTAHPSQLPSPEVLVPTIQRNPMPMHQQPGYLPPGQGEYFNAPSVVPRPEQVQGLPPSRSIERPRLSNMQQQQQPQMMHREMHSMNQTHLQQPGLVVPKVVAQPEREAEEADLNPYGVEKMLQNEPHIA
ncbi:hypothetical protein B9Z55_015876 [Caenorhabditis nigoni]|uniref:Uncharacterized protein n=1 Tax=Caenorhabditis nigoni TaxID=1611254 RepID=A0A2G5UC52_9PELO|nr:hypothetical protein B9Z55_015876 [Caenorhabditis nigoni]